VYCLLCLRELEWYGIFWRTLFLGGYCSTVQGLLDGFEVDLGFPGLFLVRLICVLSVLFERNNMVLHLLVKDKRCNTIVLFEANNFVLHLLVHYCLSGGSPPQRHQTSGLFSKKTEGNGIVFHILVQYSLSIEY